MALDTLGVVSGEYRKRLLLRNLVNSDDPDRIAELGLAMLIPQQYTTQQSDNRQFIASAISIKNFINSTFKGDGTGESNSSMRAFTSQDYTYSRQYPSSKNDDLQQYSIEPLVPQRNTFKVSEWKPNTYPKISNNMGGGQDMSKPQVDGILKDNYWEQNNKFQLGDKKDLLSFTQSLLKNYSSDSVGKVIDQTQTRYQNPDGGADYTKGSNIKDIDNPQKLAREFTVNKPYSKISDLVRNEGNYMIDGNKSSLDKNGFARIAPPRSSFTDFGDSQLSTPKNLMFSIENLAWADNTADIPCGEVGPGDGGKNPTRGRIMWFPPYGITITDNSTVNWATTNFVGRGEPIYTYNNTERSMTLQFKVIVDHPSILNAMKNQRGPNQISLNQYFSATSGKLKSTIKNRLGYVYDKIGIPKNKQARAEVMLAQEGKSVKLGDIDSSFSLPKNIVPQTIYYSADTISFLDNVTGNTKNSSFNLNGFIDDLFDVIEVVNISMVGNSTNKYTLSCTGETQDTIDLTEDRYNDAVLYIVDALKNKGGGTINPAVLSAINDINTTTTTKFNNSTESGCDPMAFQSLNIKVQYNPKKDKTLTKKDKNNTDLLGKISNNLGNVFLKGGTIPICETDYFEAMDKNDRIALFSNLKQKLDYFHPAFHSITPEGFNKRLTFLLQCTRQGPSINVGSTKTETNQPSNSAFGRPPVCILRIGDFYYTKVVIDSCNISYDENLWDLNPDGIGIQPMIATIDLNMKMIGGSSLEAPVSKLQNALSYNFFANTEVYQTIPPDPIPPKPVVPKPDTPPADIEPVPVPEAPEVTLPGISGFTTINHVLDGEDLLITYNIGQTCEDLKAQVFKTVIDVHFPLDGPITEEITLEGRVIGEGTGGATIVNKILKAGDDIYQRLVFKGVKIFMNTTYSVRISIKERPEIFSTSETITFPSQTKWDVAGAIYGITAGVPNIPYSYNPFSTYSTVSNVNITPWICKSYWCKSGESPNMDPDLDRGYGLGNCYTGPGD